MEDYEATLYERITKIQDVIHQYGEDNFCMSYSGGKDSNVLHTLLDLAIPENTIPRVYLNTGIEYKMVSDFVKEKAKEDKRIHIINPQRNIRDTLEKYGYPFKSKEHSMRVKVYYNSGMTLYIYNYIHRIGKYNEKQGCPLKLSYQFTNENKLKISDLCCEKIKEEPLKLWKIKANRSIDIIGVRRQEGGRRRNAKCLAFNGENLKAFQPLVPVSDKFENWLIEKYEIKLPEVYYPPYNFERTGCKGCPFNLNLQEQLDIMEKLLPTEKEQCERIWKPVYDEYRRIGYRLRAEGYKESEKRPDND